MEKEDIFLTADEEKVYMSFWLVSKLTVRVLNPGECSDNNVSNTQKESAESLNDVFSTIDGKYAEKKNVEAHAFIHLAWDCSGLPKKIISINKHWFCLIITIVLYADDSMKMNAL